MFVLAIVLICGHFVIVVRSFKICLVNPNLVTALYESTTSLPTFICANFRSHFIKYLEAFVLASYLAEEWLHSCSSAPAHSAYTFD